MANIVIAGGGIVALTTAMFLAEDGNQVTLLERDAAAAPSPSDAWESWERRGVNQFRLPHFFMPRFRLEMERELPQVIKAMDAAGAMRLNAVALAPDSMTGGHRDGDDDFEALTGRRPVIESVVAVCAEATPGVEIRRGVTVTGLVTGASVLPGTPHVTGVRTESGEEIAADLVVDATGRRSPLMKWLEQAGSRPPIEDLEDSGFMYLGRHFRSTDGSVPPAMGPLAQEYGSIGTLTLPGDNGTWAVVITISAKDKVMRSLSDPAKWEALVRALPLVAHWLEGEPLEDRIVVMAKIEDRHRSFVVDGKPVATGVAALADAWSCTNPSLGRGVTIGTLHGIALRDVLRRSGVDDPVELSAEWEAETLEKVEPWYTSTLSVDRHRLAQVDAEIAGVKYESSDPAWEMGRAITMAAGRDPDCLRAFLSIASVLKTPDEVFGVPGFFEKVVANGSDWRESESFGPSRSDLVTIAAG